MVTVALLSSGLVFSVGDNGDDNCFGGHGLVSSGSSNCFGGQQLIQRVTVAIASVDYNLFFCGDYDDDC